MRERLTRPFRSLRVRNYRFYFFGQVVSTSGTWMQQIAIAWLALRLTNSPFALGITIALQSLPYLLIGAWGRPHRRPSPQTEAADLHADRADNRAGPALGPHRNRNDRDLDGLRDHPRARGRQRLRQPGAAELCAGDGRPRQPRERGLAQRFGDPDGPAPRAGDRRADHRYARSRPVLPAERPDLRLHDRDAASDQARGSDPSPITPRGPGQLEKGSGSSCIRRTCGCPC